MIWRGEREMAGEKCRLPERREILSLSVPSVLPVCGLLWIWGLGGGIGVWCTVWCTEWTLDA